MTEYCYNKTCNQSAGIHKIFADIGRRKPVMFSFLSRRNPLNVWIGRLREPKTSGSTD